MTTTITQNGVGRLRAFPASTSAVRSIPAARRFGSNFTHNKAYELQNIVTLSEGTHAIKIGARARQADLQPVHIELQWHLDVFNAPKSGNFRLPRQACANPTSLDLYQQTELLLSQGVPISTVLAEGCGPTQFTLSSGIPVQGVRQFDLGVFRSGRLAIRTEPDLSGRAL